MAILTLRDFFDIDPERITDILRTNYAHSCYNETLRQLYRRWNGKLTDYIKNRLDIGSSLDAEEATHLIWLPVLEHYARKDRPHNIPWAFILQREVSKFLRLNERREFKRRMYLPDADVMAKIMLETIPKQQADAFRFYYMDGGDYNEIGHVLHLHGARHCIPRLVASARLSLQINFHSLTAIAEDQTIRRACIRTVLALSYEKPVRPPRLRME